MAGTVGQGAEIVGQALIPETLARLRAPGLIEQAQRKQQIGDIQGRRLLGGMNAEIGTPQTKQFSVPNMDDAGYLQGGSKTYGQDNASTVAPMFSPSKKMGLFSQAFPEQGRALMASQLAEQMNPPKPEVKAYNPGQVVGTQQRDGTFTPTFTVPTAPENPFPKAGTTRKFQRGMNVVEQEADGKGGWKDLATGPAFKPETPNAQDPYKRVDYWRDKIDPEYKAVNESAISFDKIERAIQGGASMSTAIQLLQKIIDERGVVRGEDVRMFNDAQPLVDAWKQELKTSTSGQLTKESAERVLNTARALVGARYNAFNNNFQAYAPLMEGESVKPTDVIPQQSLDRFSMRRFQPPAPPGAAGTAQAGGAAIPTPQTADDFSKLPSGAVYIDPDDGRQYRKP